MSQFHPSPYHPNFKDLTGQKFGCRKVLEYAGNGLWLCRCDCGQKGAVRGSELKRGINRQCRRCGRAALRLRYKRLCVLHRGEYRSWQNMRSRCYNKKRVGYADYGGRGITVCERWRDSLAAFLEDMGAKPTPKHSIERKDNDGNYEPGNCRWATRAEQNRNMRRNKWLTFQGETLCLSDWAARLGIAACTLFGRFRRGWSLERCLTEPRHANQAVRFKGDLAKRPR